MFIFLSIKVKPHFRKYGEENKCHHIRVFLICIKIIQNVNRILEQSRLLT